MPSRTVGKEVSRWTVGAAAAAVAGAHTARSAGAAHAVARDGAGRVGWRQSDNRGARAAGAPAAIAAAAAAAPPAAVTTRIRAEGTGPPDPSRAARAAKRTTAAAAALSAVCRAYERVAHDGPCAVREEDPERPAAMLASAAATASLSSSAATSAPAAVTIARTAGAATTTTAMAVGSRPCVLTVVTAPKAGADEGIAGSGPGSIPQQDGHAEIAVVTATAASAVGAGVRPHRTAGTSHPVPGIWNGRLPRLSRRGTAAMAIASLAAGAPGMPDGAGSSLAGR